MTVFEQNKNPLEGKRLDYIIQYLVDYYEGWEGLCEMIRINCFYENPSMNSSLKFLRKTPWARTKVENQYLKIVRRTGKE